VENDVILEMKGIVKRYPGVVALDEVDFDLRSGEVHALVGENGAGKSTLVKVLAGATAMDAGEIRLHGQETEIQSPHHAQELGISMIYQEFNLSPYLSVAENIFLGREPLQRHTPFIDWSRMYKDARDILGRIDVSLDVRRPVNELSVAEQQMVEIGKALSFNAKILVMDEPSATLTEHELESLFDLIRSLKQQGMGIIYISHRMEELFEVGDRVTVMRDGKRIGTEDVGEVRKEQIIRMMVGRTITEEFPKLQFERGPEILRVQGLNRTGVLKDISFSVHRGEIVGITGLVGAGRTELARAVFGADPSDSGEIFLNSRKVNIRSPQDAIKLGVGLLTEDRKNQGLVIGMKVRENITLSGLGMLVRRIFIDLAREKAEAERYASELQIKTPSVEQFVKNLSGGNQQKVVLAKWLFTKSKMLLFDEPTRGIDVGAKREIYRLINELVSRGVGVVFISSELPEVIGMCDRILVMHEGRIVAEIPHAEATQEKVMHYATGGDGSGGTAA
jgi:ribose transport system ATP-binding protein